MRVIEHSGSDFKDGFINYRSNEEFTYEEDVADFGCTGGCSSLG
jgi:hypothetical protein